METQISDRSLASKNAGYLLALSWITSTTDLHSQNIIFSDNVPRVLDDECVCHPLRDEQLSELAEERCHYSFSPFRTLLIKERILGNRKGEAGFTVLQKSGMDFPEFRNAVHEGLDALRSRRDIFADLLHDYCRNHTCSRYLARTTEFYDLCIFRICHSLTFSSNQTVEEDLAKLFIKENSIFPNLVGCVPSEMASVIRGDIPYIKLNMLEGNLIDGATGSTVGSVTPVPDWMERHWTQVFSVPKSQIDKWLDEWSSQEKLAFIS